MRRALKPPAAAAAAAAAAAPQPLTQPTFHASVMELATTLAFCSWLAQKPNPHTHLQSSTLHFFSNGDGQPPPPPPPLPTTNPTTPHDPHPTHAPQHRRRRSEPKRNSGSKQPGSPSQHTMKGPPTTTTRIPLLLLLPLLPLLAAAASPSSRVHTLLATMSLEEKVGQMLQLDLLSFLNPGTLELNTTRLAQTLRQYHVGSILNSPFTLGPAGGKDGWTAADWKALIRTIHETALEVGAVPPLYGIDSVHGANYVLGATLFPQQINAAASFNRDLVWSMGRVQGKDTKAAGIPWLFAPILGINTQPLWSRSFETFGECPFVAAEMGKAIVQGMQTEDDPAFPNFPPAAACMKHFIAYPNPNNGHDRSPIELDQRTVLQLYAPPFRAAVQAGVKSAMEAYTEVAGVRQNLSLVHPIPVCSFTHPLSNSSSTPGAHGLLQGVPRGPSPGRPGLRRPFGDRLQRDRQPPPVPLRGRGHGRGRGPGHAGHLH